MQTESLPALAQQLAAHLGLPVDGYLAEHWARLAHTAALVPAAAADGRPLDLLEIGTAAPFPLLALLAGRQRLGRLAAVAEPDPQRRVETLSLLPFYAHPAAALLEGGNSHPTAALLEGGNSHPTAALLEGGVPRPITLARRDVERDPLPWPDDSFDLVLALEIVEHLPLTPLPLVREACRVLRPGGRLILTTPNIAGAEALARLVAGHAPYSFGVYTAGGVHGRHNREFTPHEIVELTEAVGFAVIHLETRDFYPAGIDTTAAWALLAAGGADPALRHQHIVCIAEKRGFHPQGWPRSLFDHDPTRHNAALHLLGHEADAAIIALVNRGDWIWPPDGPAPVVLAGEWLDQPEAEPLARNARWRLPRAVAPGETLTLRLKLAGGTPEGWLRLGLVQEEVAWFAEGGISQTLSLPVARAAFAAAATAGIRLADGAIGYAPPAPVLIECNDSPSSSRRR